MGVPITVVDAFTDRAFGGNPAAVCQLPAAADEDWMQAVAAETNLPATAFTWPRSDGDHELRWFTPTVELPLCGHATLATTHVLGRETRYHTRAGELIGRVTDDGRVELDFAAVPTTAVEPAPPDVLAGVGLGPDQVVEVRTAEGWRLVEVPSPSDVRRVVPHRAELLTLGEVAVVVLAMPGDRPGIDSVCRVFEPAYGLDEDPATGSVHCLIAPWLAERTGHEGSFTGEQASARGGIVGMRLAHDDRGGRGGQSDRVILTGQAVTVLEGTLQA